MNCGKTRSDVPGLVWSSVYVCTDCGNLANIVYKNGVKELDKLKLLLQETIRILLIQGKLTATSDVAPSKADVFKQIISLKDAAESRSPCR